MARREPGTAYLLWCASLLGVCGLQRFYLGQTLVGALYLVSFGFCGVAQLIDLFLIPGLVERSNQAVTARRLQGSATPPLPSLTLEQQILRRCEHEPVTLAHFILATGEPSERVRELVEEMAAQGLLKQTISESGSVLYQLN